MASTCEDVGGGSAAGEHLHGGVCDPGESALWAGSGHPESGAGSRGVSARMSAAPGPPGGLGPGEERGCSSLGGRRVHGVSAHCMVPVSSLSQVKGLLQYVNFKLN